MTITRLLPSPLRDFIGIHKTNSNKISFNEISERYEALFRRYPSLHKVKFIGVETFCRGNVILPKSGKQGMKTSFFSPTLTSLHPFVPFFAGVFSSTIYFCVLFSKRNLHWKTTNTTQIHTLLGHAYAYAYAYLKVTGSMPVTLSE